VRIAFVTALYLPHTGGLEVLASQMLAELHQRGHDVTVVTSLDDRTHPAHEVIGGVEVVRTDAHDVIARRDLPGILRVQRDTWELLRHLRPDVIHAHDGSPALWMYLRAARAARPPLLLTLHSVMTRQFASTGASLDGLRTMLRAADAVTGVTRPVVDDACALEPAIAGRASVVPNGVAWPPRAWVPQRDDDHVLCVGRLVASKGFDRALRALHRLADVRPSVRLTIAGDGPERGRLEQLAGELRLRSRVEFLGEVPHDRIPSLVDASTVVLMPSRFEGMPLVALEAAWLGRPVVAAAVPGLDEVIVSGTTGLLVDGDDDALATAVGSLLADRALARSMGAAAQQRAVASFSLETCVDRYEALYRRLGNRDGMHPPLG
jgi:glycogen(starch) synthase